MNTPDPKRLRELREHAGFSQADIARKVHVDKTVISRWESGERTPSMDQLIRLSSVLGITLDYLLNAELAVQFQFRARKVMQEKDAIRQALVDAEMQIHYLHSVYRLAEQLPRPFAIKMDFLQNQLRAITKQIRTTLMLNQRIVPEELRQALTEFNVHVFEWALPWDISGLSYRNTYAVIFINRIHSRERQLFTLAHEFAHVLFHLGRNGKKTIVSQISSNREQEEKDANAFAAELLVPGDVLDDILKSVSVDVRRIEALDSIARYFNVSREAVFYRLVEKGVFSWNEKRSYFSKPHAHSAPLGTRVQDINSQIAPDFLQLALQIHGQGRISTGKLNEWFFSDRITLDDYLAKRTRAAEEILELGGT